MTNQQDTDGWKTRSRTTLLSLLIAAIAPFGGLTAQEAEETVPEAEETAPPKLAIVRGPYLQLVTPESAIVRFRTNVACPGKASIAGPDGVWRDVPGDPAATEHSVAIRGLSPKTTYRYAVHPDLDTRYAFTTPPATGTRADTRIWVIGDSGTGDNNARAVRDAFLRFTGDRAPDLWLMLGDNAYSSGTDDEYQRAVFKNMYERLLPRVSLWPTFGNHDARSSDSATQTGAYYDIFSLPTRGEAGGEPSGTEAFYAFDHGDIHFICLDSAESSRRPDSTMMRWLEADLQSTRARWIVAFWHHPPYTRGSHDSDYELQLIEMRKYAVPLLERGGVDLVLSGHSHSYERSHLLRGHLGPSWTLEPGMLADTGGGGVDENGNDGSYRPDGATGGAVYAVAGASGKLSGGLLDHPVMYASFNLLGSIVIDVHGDQLDARYLTSHGAVADHFTLKKTEAPARKIAHTALPKRATWKAYISPTQKNARRPAENWAQIDFSDTLWSTREAPVGYGEPYVSQEVSSPMQTIWLRTRFDLQHAPDAIESIRMHALFDDGFQAFLNGVEVTRVNLDPGAIDPAAQAKSSTEASRYKLYAMRGAAGLLKKTGNVLAVRVHNSQPKSNDLIFDAEVTYDTYGDR